MAGRQPPSPPDVKPFVGFVETTLNALRLIQAARQGVIPRITRRLNDAERRSMIKSGSTFVFGVEESGIKRWTDGLLWSPSRIVGNFLVYREINERTNSRGHHQRKPYPTEAPNGNFHDQQRSISYASPQQIAEPKAETFKEHGLIKKTITVTMDGSDLHLISYYTAEDIRSGLLKRPTSRQDIMALDLPPHLFRLTNFRNPPKVEAGPDGRPRLVCEAEDLEPPDCNNYNSNGISSNIDDAPYRISGSPDWPSESRTTDLVSSFSGTSLSRVLRPSTDSSSGIYSGEDRWVGQYELASRVSPVHGRRHESLWSSSAAAHNPYNRDGTLSENTSIQPDSWTSTPSAWNTERSVGGNYSRSHHNHHYNLYDTMPTSAGTTTSETSSVVDRSRPNLRNTGNHISEGNTNGCGEMATYSSYGHFLGNPEANNSQHLGWSFPGEKMGSSSGSRPFTPAPSTSLTSLNPNHHQGYDTSQSYQSLWSAGSSDSDSDSPQAQVQASMFPSLGELSYFAPGGDRYINTVGDYRDR